MDEQRLAEIEERRVRVSLGKWAMPLPQAQDPYLWTHEETGVLVDDDVPALVAEVRRLQRENHLLHLSRGSSALDGDD